MEEKLRALVARAEEIDHLMGQPEVAADHEQLTRLAKERAELAPVVTAYAALTAAHEDLAAAQELARDPDPEMAGMAREEISRLGALQTELEEQLRLALVPRDPNDDRNVIMEIRAGTGGDEAALFAADLFRMYQRYAQRHALVLEVVDSSLTEGGGIKELVAEVTGNGAYRLLKHESGVHRVQRVPATETLGRIHTSTATVAVLPEAEEVDVDINPTELRMDIFHSGGPGGQNVNKVATAIRLVHIPTGIMVVSQDERSQLKNKQKAMTVMRTRLLERKKREQAESTSAARRSQVGTGERSEKVRTYNFPQDRLTDHRVGVSVHGLEGILAGNIDEVVDALLADEQARLLQEATA
jgi:peptide chain release factor 1